MTTNSIITLGRSDSGTLQAQDSEEHLREALDTLDTLRDALVTGRIKGFIAVGVSHNHDAFAWSGKRSAFTLLEAQGAWASLYGMIEEVL